MAVAKKNEEREFNSLLTKYELQIKSLHLEHAQEVKDNQKKFNEDKIALSNKMTTRYEQMLTDQKNSS